MLVARASRRRMPVTVFEVFRSRIVFNVIELIPDDEKEIPDIPVVRVDSWKIILLLIVQLSFTLELPTNGKVMPFAVKFFKILPETLMLLFVTVPDNPLE